MGRRLLYLVAMAMAVGVGVQLAQAGDPPPPPADAPSTSSAPPSELEDLLKSSPDLPGPELPDDRPADPVVRKGANVKRTGPAPAAKAKTKKPKAGTPGNATPKDVPSTTRAGAETKGVGDSPGRPSEPADGFAPPEAMREGRFDPPPELPPVDPLPPPPARELPGARVDPEVERAQAPAASPAAPLTGNPLPPAIGSSPGQPPPDGTTRTDEKYVLSADGLPLGRQSIALTVDVLGPQTINLNQPIKLKIVVRNTGNADAKGVVVRDQLPDGLVFVSSQPAKEPNSESLLVWSLGMVPANSEKPITLTVKATKTAMFEHAATVTMRLGAKTQTIVHDPKLKVELIATPGKVLKGKQVSLQIAVTNIGDGIARKVVVQAKLSPGLRAMEPDEPGGQNLFRLDLGSLKPHERTELEPLVVDTITGGEQTCEVKAISPDVVAGLEGSKDTKLVTVEEPKLRLNLDAPVKRYTDTTADYTVTLENPGTATARNVRVAVTVPFDGRPTKVPPPGHWDASQRRIYWTYAQLEPGEKEKLSLPFEVRVGKPGFFEVIAEAKADLGLSDSARKSTEVVGMANLDLEVKAVKRVVDIGDRAAYQIVITNRGTKDATKLLVSAKLTDNLAVKEVSNGTDDKTGAHVEPTTGKLMFAQIDRLAKGQELDLVIYAEATKPGAAVCRVYLQHDDDPASELEDVAKTMVDGTSRQ